MGKSTRYHGLAHVTKLAKRRIEQMEREAGFDGILPTQDAAQRIQHLNRKARRRYQSPSVQRAIKAAAAKLAKQVEEAA